MADIDSPREFLKDMLEVSDRLDADREAQKKSRELKKQLETSLASLKNTIEREKNDTIRSRRADIESGFDRQLKSVNGDIRKLQDRRQKSLGTQMKQRTEEMTRGVKQQTKDAKRSLKAYVSEKKLPFILKSRLYYTLFCPVILGYLLLIAVFVLILTAAVVYARAGIAAGTAVLPFVVAGIADILLLFLYVFIWANTRVKYRDEITECLSIIGNMKEGERQAKRIEKDIKKAGDDSTYDLSKYDSELKEKEQKKASIEAEKQKALDSFDNVTRGTLTAGIDKSYASKLEDLNGQIAANDAELEKLSSSVHELETRINKEYIPYVGARNATRSGIEQMLSYIDSGEAASVADAAAMLSRAGSR